MSRMDRIEQTLALMAGKLDLLLICRIASENIEPIAKPPGIVSLPYPPGLQLQTLQLDSVDEAIKAIFSDLEEAPETIGIRPDATTLQSTCAQTDSLLQDLMLDFLETKIEQMNIRPAMVSHGTQIVHTADTGCSAGTTKLWSNQLDSAPACVYRTPPQPSLPSTLTTSLAAAPTSSKEEELEQEFQVALAFALALYGIAETFRKDLRK